ncbi:hypothetical protein MMC11_004059 [Xylographa trunciseda]|nr:hypothetical protein [Xylographa trunciseda]
MAILFEAFEAVHQGNAVAPQPPQSKNLLSITSAFTPKMAAQAAARKANRDKQIASAKDKHARLIAQEETRVGFEVGYYTNTETREYRVLSYSPSVRDRVLGGEVFPKELRRELLRMIPGYTEPILENQIDRTSNDGKKSRKRSHSALGTTDTNAKDAVATVTLEGHPIDAEQHPVGRPRKRLTVEITYTEATSSLPTITAPNLTPPRSVSPESTVENQRDSPASIDKEIHPDCRHFPKPPFRPCEESCPHPVTGQEQLMLAHGGRVLPCANLKRHDPQMEQEYKPVCQQCIVAGHELLQAYRPYLLTPALLPLCKDCTQEAKAKYPSTTGYNGCSCPLQLPSTLRSRKDTEPRFWNFCLRCRVQWLERTSVRLVAEEEFRRGIVGAGVVKGKAKTIFHGRLCICGKHLGGTPFSDDGLEDCAKRCAGCGGIWHAGTSTEDEDAAPVVAQ